MPRWHLPTFMQFPARYTVHRNIGLKAMPIAIMRGLNRPIKSQANENSLYRHVGLPAAARHHNRTCRKPQRQKSVRAAMCRVPWNRYQRNGSAGQKKQPSYAGSDNGHVQKAPQRLSGRDRVIGHTAPQW